MDHIQHSKPDGITSTIRGSSNTTGTDLTQDFTFYTNQSVVNLNGHRRTTITAGFRIFGVGNDGGQ